MACRCAVNDQGMDGIMDPVAVAMSSAFVPFPAGVAAAPPPRRKVEYATGIAVDGTGHILTHAQAADGCYVITVAGLGNADRVAEDKDAELALLRVYGAQNLLPVTFSGEAQKGPDVTLVGIADPQAQAGGGAVTTARARLADGAAAFRPVDPAPALGFSGAAALDGQGRLIGMVALKTAVVAGTAATGTGAQAVIVPSEAIKPFLEKEGIAPAPSAPPGLDAARVSIVRVICVRK